MGLPQNSIDTPPQPKPSSTPSELPPEAIDLATKLFNFARQGKTAELGQYIGAGIPPNLTNGKGDTLVMLAAYHGHADTVRMLLEKGADPNVLNERGQSPLAGAVFKAEDEVVKILFEAGARTDYGQPNAVDSARIFRKDDYLTLFGVEA
ncbi:hypothetical protein LTR66_004338 [Elasticomyces elasticus]|nr:hypothetical protein LTR50_001652 [Elasticomyces elasticus]KAK4995944.1 hypothetical protein LTR66_004338 [Elasticomyces elasticus]